MGRTTAQFDQMCDAACRAIRTVRPYTSGDERAGLNHADYILHEVRLFAQFWDECRSAEEAGTITPEAATKTRQDLMQRLGGACVPSRL